MADAAVQIIGGMDPAANAVLASLGGRYRVLSELGRGGFGQVLLAEDELLRRRVAIKILRKARRDTPVGGFAADTAFLTEARMVARMEHVGIVPIYDVIELEEGGYCIVSRYVEGRTLRDHLGERRFTPMEAVAVAAGLCEALSHAHKLGVVHRDVKPANVMLSSDQRPLLLDFGLARSWSELDGQGLAAGTPGYMSPEQARGEDHLINNRSDIFSLGAVFYEMLTGQQAFPCGSARQQMDLMESGAPPPPRQIEPRVPRELERICLKALQPQIRMRYAMAADMLEDLRLWQVAMKETVVGAPAVAVAGEGKAPVPAAPASGQHSAMPRVVPRGLRAFDQGDADFFLKLVPGPRDRHGLPESLRFWKQRIESDDPTIAFRVGVLYGPSGCGKSSLIRAGLLPRCAEHITIAFHEARHTGNASRLARALWQKFPSLAPFGDSPPELLQKLRHNGSLRGGRKLLIVIDQAEQWLRAGESQGIPLEAPDSHGETIASGEADNPGHEDEETLLNTLRQCDGTQVQILMLVRDDFWRSVSRLLADADVELDGSNSALVDLFEPRHAEMVLESFGRAYGCLPEDPAAPLARTAREFIRESVRSLEEDRRISPVRLALFAEMFRDREWSPDGLRKVGGVGGVAVTFLDESFRGPTARAQHRAHEGAARRVLQLFVPETGDVRGAARQQSEMLEASGYEPRPKAFQELLHVLDADLRLLTPVDTLETTDGQASWQLTHDHMVAALREWLLARKADTLGGRAEIRLSERAREWHARPDPTRLPGVWEWARLRILTRRERWNSVERTWMREGMKCSRRFAVWSVTGLLVFTLALHEFRGREHGAEVFKLVMGAPPSDVRRIMAEGLAWKGWALPLLKQAAQEPADTLRGLNARLALIDSDARHVSTLAKVMLEADAPVFTTIRKALAGRTDIPVHQFQAVLRDSAATHGHKLRAYVALAAFSPEDVLVGELGSEAAQWLLTAEGNPGEWAGQLQPVASRLGVALEAALHADDAPLNLQRTTAALASLHAGDSTRLIRLLPLAPPASVSPLTSELERIPGAGELLEEAARQGLARLGQKGSQILDAGGEASFRGQANMLLACLILKKEQHVWPCLKRGADRTLRSFIFLNAADAGVPAELLLNRLFNEMDEGIVQGLLLALCGYPHSALSVSGQQKAMKWLRDTYTRHPDGGVHSSIATLLKRWSLHKDLELLNRALPRSPAPAPGMRWWVTPSGVDMRIVCLAEDHITALGAQEVTEAEFTALCQKPASPIPPSAKSVPGLAATGVKWNDAALYCMELSSVEGLAPDQQSYVRTGDELRPQSETSDRQGYRLATKAEWLEAALPNNARSRWDFGNAASLASSFAWLAATSNGKSHPVAGLLPNENGLWDSIGNVAEWSHDGSRADQWTSVFLLGGSFATLLSETSQVHMRTAGTGTLHPEAGFRLARRLIRDGQPRSR